MFWSPSQKLGVSAFHMTLEVWSLRELAIKPIDAAPLQHDGWIEPPKHLEPQNVGYVEVRSVRACAVDPTWRST